MLASSLGHSMSDMESYLRVLVLALGLFLIFTASFLPIFFNDLASGLAPAFHWLEMKHEYNSSRTPRYPKYFHEGQKGGVLHHYDGRFQHGILLDATRMEAQTHMMRAYLEFSKEHSLQTWLAHGTLLGWWWNAKVLPWDLDIDVQLSLRSLEYLATHHNHTVYDYTSSQIAKVNPPLSVPTNHVECSYLIDINPAYASRAHGDGDNVIDGRFIDMRNGLYIDLTAVSEIQPSRHPDLWMDKNEHRYKTQDLYPLRETLFEGVPTKVPYAYVRILSEEYQEKALVVTEYEGHRWNYSSMLWTKKTPQDMKQDRLDMAEAQRQKLAEKEKKKKAKAKAKLKAPTADGNRLDEVSGEFGDALKPEAEPARRQRRAAVTDELIAELEEEEELIGRAKRRKERQDVL